MKTGEGYEKRGGINSNKINARPLPPAPMPTCRKCGDGFEINSTKDAGATSALQIRVDDIADYAMRLWNLLDASRSVRRENEANK